MPCNEAYAAISACLNGRKMAIKIENINKKNIRDIVFENPCKPLKRK